MKLWVFFLFFSFSLSAGDRRPCLEAINQSLKKRDSKSFVKKFSRKICSLQKKISANRLSRSERKILESNINIASIQNFYKKRCLFSINGLGGSIIGEMIIKTLLSEEVIDPNIVTNHYTNFAEGLGAMAVLHNCLAYQKPEYRKKFFMAALGLNMAGNIIFEVGEDHFFSNRKKTDWADLTAGSVATLMYYILSRYSEKKFLISFEGLCRH